MGILDLMESASGNLGKPPDWEEAGRAFLESHMHGVFKKGWEADHLEWDKEVGMYAIVDTEGNVRGWVGSKAIHAMEELAREGK